MTHEGGPGSGPQGKGLSNTDLKVGKHYSYDQSNPAYKSGVKYEKPSTYPKSPGRIQMSQQEKLAGYSSGPPHISTYPLTKGGSILAQSTKTTKEADSPSPATLKGCLMPQMSKEADGGSTFPQALRGQDDEKL